MAGPRIFVAAGRWEVGAAGVGDFVRAVRTAQVSWKLTVRGVRNKPRISRDLRGGGRRSQYRAVCCLLLPRVERGSIGPEGGEGCKEG